MYYLITTYPDDMPVPRVLATGKTVQDLMDKIQAPEDAWEHVGQDTYNLPEEQVVLYVDPDEERFCGKEFWITAASTL